MYGTTGRMEKAHRLMNAELTLEYDPVEAGLALPRVKSADFVGKKAYLQAREQTPAATLCTLAVDDHTGSEGQPRYMTGNEPVLTLDGEPIVDAKGRRSYVTSAGSAPSLGRYLLMAYLPPELAVEGTALLVEYMSDHFPVSVLTVGRTAPFDPDNTPVVTFKFNGKGRTAFARVTKRISERAAATILPGVSNEQ